MAGERLLNIIQQASNGERTRSDPADFVYGIVLSVSPLVIQPENKLPLDADFLILSALCRPFSVSQFGQLWRGLAAGDHVRMLQCAGGQKFYVLEREGAL